MTDDPLSFVWHTHYVGRSAHGPPIGIVTASPRVPPRCAAVPVRGGALEWSRVAKRAELMRTKAKMQSRRSWGAYEHASDMWEYSTLCEVIGGRCLRGLCSDEECAV